MRKFSPSWLVTERRRTISLLVGMTWTRMPQVSSIGTLLKMKAVGQSTSMASNLVMNKLLQPLTLLTLTVEHRLS